MLDFAPREWDLLSLSAQVFAPAAVALVVCLMCLMPRRFPEVARWVALAGAAAVLTLGLCRLVDYHTVLDSYSDRTTTSLYHPAARLDSRADQQAEDAHRPVPRAFRSDDLFTRRPWAARLGIDYALGVDGLGLAVVLLANLAAVVAVVRTWHETDGVHTTLALVLLGESAVTGAALAADLALFTAFAGGGVLAVAGLLATSGGVPRRFLVASGVGGFAWLSAVSLLHTADVRDFVDPNVRAARAADLRQVDPRLTEADALERTAVHTLDPVTLGKFLRAAALVHSGRTDRLAARRTVADLPRPGDDPHAVPLVAPGVKPADAAERISSQSAGSPNFQRAILLLVLTAAAAVLLAGGVALTRVPVAAGVFVAGVVVPFAGLLLLRYALPLAPLAARDNTVPLSLLGTVAAFAGFVAAVRTADLVRLAGAQFVSGAGFVLLGVAAWGSDPAAWERGVGGAALLVIADGLSGPALVFAAGCLARRHGLADAWLAGNLLPHSPRLAVGVASAVLLGAGVTGTLTFTGQFAVLGAATAHHLWLALPATAAAVALAVRRFVVALRVVSGPPADTRPVTDLDAGESLTLATLAALSVAAGLVPTLVLVWVDPTVQGWVDALAPLR